MIDPPCLEQQLEDILVFIGKKFRENEDLIDLPINPPKCENIVGRAKYEYWEDAGLEITPLSNPHRDWRGAEINNCRVCPHCNALMYSSAAIGQTIQCFQCGGHSRWCS